MAAYFKLSPPSGAGVVETIPWHVGEGVRSLDAHRCFSVQADGDELASIYDQFHEIPQAFKQRVVVWFGDHAKFILANLR